MSGIINKYFSVCDEVTSAKSKPCVLNYVPATPMPSVTMNVRSSRGRNKSSGVGKRLIVTANNLGVSTSDKKPMVSLCRYNGDKSSFVANWPSQIISIADPSLKAVVTDPSQISIVEPSLKVSSTRPTVTDHQRRIRLLATDQRRIFPSLKAVCFVVNGRRRNTG
ncbi:hypothetical protein OSB04_un000003 [Centaurea solstitialis]|uniref:Uncharacterized protein n=1 Tax=Centaurea solstitialis TaxID=347529 RepID=A0AA38W420_9ASTR|nr:hypothetical protein OSB04_un000003 [Centaurea solstitialis]